VALGLHEKTAFEKLGRRRQRDLATNGNGNGSHAAGRLDHHFNFNPRPSLPEAYQFHFQITGLGRSILAAGATGPAKALAAAGKIALPFRDNMFNFTVLPNLDIVAPPDLNLLRFYHLRQFTAIRHIDVMSTLAITHDSVRAAMEHGLKGEDILAFLEEGCPGGLPETVRHLVNECSNRYGEVVIGYSGGYILVDDPALEKDIRSSKTLAPWIKDVQGDNMILLNRDVDVPHMAEELKLMGFMPSVDSENVYASSDGRLRFSLTPQDLGALMAVLRFVGHVESELGVELTEEKLLPLMNALRPGNGGELSIDHYTDVLSKRFEKLFDASIRKRLDAVTSKYRRQMREFIEQQSHKRARPVYPHTNPATTKKEIRSLLEFAIEHDSRVVMDYTRSTGEEIVEPVQPESLNHDKLFAFNEENQSFCAYRLKRIRAARIE
jgi:Helicase conserved C-terminal domain